MTAAFTVTVLKLLHCPSFSSNPLQQGCPKGSVKGILLFPRTAFLGSPIFAHVLSNAASGNLPNRQCLKD